MIPKNIYTAWFSEDNIIPEREQKWIESQKIEGYEHILLTLDNIDKSHPYIQECLNSKYKSKKFVKLTDFIRMQVLYQNGGFFLDADVSILNKRNFNSLLNNSMVVGLEGPGTIPNSVVIGSAIVGAEIGNPYIKEWMDRVFKNFRGDTDDCYESSMDILNIIAIKYQDKIKILEPDYFYPYNHVTGKTNITDRTICIHHFNKSWIDILPTVSIIIPQLGREDELVKALDSIKNLNYPKELIETYIVEGDDTVPQKLARTVPSIYSDYICYFANDTIFDKDCIKNAVMSSIRNKKGLVSFNEATIGFDKGNICTHFIIKRDLVKRLVNEQVFDLRFIHVGCDNFLWRQCEIMNECYWEETAKIVHNHFSTTKTETPMDSTYQKGWSNIEKDRKTLQDLLKTL